MKKEIIKILCLKKFLNNRLLLKIVLMNMLTALRARHKFLSFSIKLEIIDKIVLIGCGTAYHSCLVAKYWFEELHT